MRPKTTGRFGTRKEFLERIEFLWKFTSCSVQQIANHCHVSRPTVSSLISEAAWQKQDETLDVHTGLLDPLPLEEQEPVEPTEHLDSRTLSSCGFGYDFEIYPLHLPDWVKRDLEIV